MKIVLFSVQRRSTPVDSVAAVFSKLVRFCNLVCGCCPAFTCLLCAQGGRTLYLYAIPAVLWLFDAAIARKCIAAWAVGYGPSPVLRAHRITRALPSPLQILHRVVLA